MFGLQSDSSINSIIYAIALEIIFLCFATVFVGLGSSEIKKGKDPIQNGILIGFGVAIAVISFYVTYIFIQS